MNTIIGTQQIIVSETNKKPETFIYELVQNADDYPDSVSPRVDVSFSIQDGYLVLTHNGAVFNQGNVNAICTVNYGDKRDAIDKIGFKGIGFKSISKSQILFGFILETSPFDLMNPILLGKVRPCLGSTCQYGQMKICSHHRWRNT